MAHRVPDWTFLTNHAHVLFCLAQDPEIRLRDVADRVGITERAVQRIVTELETGTYITRQRNGRRNSYIVHKQLFLRHPIESHCSVAELLHLILSENVPHPKTAPVDKAAAADKPAPEGV